MQTVATLARGWVDATHTGDAITTTTTCMGCNCWPCSCRNYTNYVTWPYNSEPSRIVLRMSEVEKLRAAAKKNPEIKKILNKFTTHIEVEVDF